MARFASGLHGEQQGHCHALRYKRQTFTRCDAGTQHREHPYCYNCWIELNDWDADAWPPLDGNQETRVAIGETKVFLLSPKQMADYAAHTDGEALSPGIDAIHSGAREPNPAWHEGDVRHMQTGGRFEVYLVRSKDGGLYVGQGRDAGERFERHRDGTGSRYLHRHGVDGKEPCWKVSVKTRKVALELEKCIHDCLHQLGIRVNMGFEAPMSSHDG